MLTRKLVCLWFAAAICCDWFSAYSEEEVDFGHNAAGQLKPDIGFDQPLELPPSIFPGISGFATGEMGFHSTPLDDPPNDFYQLSTAADFRFILLAKDPGMEVWDDHGSGYLTNGQSFFVGQAPFDTHPIWNIVTGVAGQTYSLTLKFRDLNGVYADSAPFALSFTPMPATGPFELRLVGTGFNRVTLSWPTNSFGWALESNVTFATATWQLVTNSPTISGTNFSLSISNPASQQFFRLHKQR